MDREGDLSLTELPKDDSQSEVIEIRSERFVDTNEDTLLRSSNLNEMTSFYQGSVVHERVAAIRPRADYQRLNWSKFDQFAHNLKSFMENEAKSTGGISGDIKKIFERKRDWADAEKPPQSFGNMKDEFNILTLFTTQKGFEELFKVLDGVFRTDDSINYSDIIDNAIFLVTLVNIDLYNFIYNYPQYSNFEGVVYRGMAIEETKCNVFKSLLAQPLNNRYISIPCSLWSSSTLLAIAIEYIKEELKKYPQHFPILMKIYVLNLAEEFLHFYQNKYGNRSIICSICAVPIHELSRYPEEAEVLLSGAFLQSLNFYNKNINGEDFKVVELVMINTNRINSRSRTMLNETEEDESRTLYGTMCGVTRNRFAVKYCKDHQLFQDMEAYEVALKEGEEKLKKLMTL